MIKVKNKTGNSEQIHFIQGESVTVLPGEEKIIDDSNVYNEELERISKFFLFIADNETVKETKSATMSKRKFMDDGGNE